MAFEVTLVPKENIELGVTTKAVFTLSNVTPSIPGPVGPQGPQGPQGIQGPPGPPGTGVNTTDDIPEGDLNLYYTEERVEAVIAVTPPAPHTHIPDDIDGFDDRVFDVLAERIIAGNAVTITDNLTEGSILIDVNVPNATGTNNGLLTASDFTKLQGIASGAEVNVNADWNATTGDAAILNKPATFPPSTHTHGNATTSVAGFMSATDKTKLDGIASGAEVNVQANWTETNAGSDAFILNKPSTFPPATHTHTSDAITDLNTGVYNSLVQGFGIKLSQDGNNDTVIDTDIPLSTTSVAGLMAAADKTKLDGIQAGAEVNVNADWNATSGDAQILNKPTVVSSVAATGPITSSGGTNPTISTSMASNRLIGRGSAGSGVMEEISIGSGLQLSGTTLSATGTSAGGGITKATASGTDTYTATITGVTGYADGDTFLIRFTNGNTTGATLNINSLGAKTLFRNNDGALIGGDITSGGEMLCVFNSTLDGFQCIGTAPNSLFAYVGNAESITITKGQPVYAFGATGDRLTVKLAYNTSDATSAQTIGLVLSDSIAAGQKGLIIVQGQLDNLGLFNPSSWADGDPVYLGATAGTLTKTKPSAPNHLVYLGTVVTTSSGNAGRMYVRVQNGYELQELHNVALSSPPNNNDGLFYETATSLWKNKSIPTVLGYTPENVANKSDSYTVSSSTTYATTKAVVDGLATKEPTIAVGTTGQYWRGDKSWQTLDKAAVGLGNVDNTSDANKPISTATQTALNAKVDANTAITGATKTKITYDSKGLVTAGADATTADIAESTNKLYVSDGDKGDITVSGGGTVWTIDPGAVTLADMANLASMRLIGRTDAGTGAPQALTIGTGLTGVTATSTVVANLSVGVENGQSAIGGTRASENLTLSSTSNATKGKILFGNSAYDEANQRLGIGTQSPTSAIHFVLPTNLSGTQNAMYLSSAFDATSSGVKSFIQYDLTTAGSSGNTWGLALNLLPGQTGTSSTQAIRILNTTTTSPTFDPISGTGNAGATVSSSGAGGGANYGMSTTASNALFNIGNRARAVGGSTIANSTNVGVLAIGNVGTSTGTVYQIGGYFTLETVTPTLTFSAALACDNGTATNDIFVARDNGTVVWKIIDGGNTEWGDTRNMVFNTSTGTKIGTATNQKLAFWNKTPIVQPTTASAASAFTANTGTTINTASTFDGYTIAKVVKALIDIGILA